MGVILESEQETRFFLKIKNSKQTYILMIMLFVVSDFDGRKMLTYSKTSYLLLVPQMSTTELV